MKKVVFIILYLSIIPIEIKAQDLTFYGFQLSYSQTGIISKKFDYNLFSSATNSSFGRDIAGVHYPSKWLQVYTQQSIIFKFSPNFNFTAGIAYNYQRRDPNAYFFKEWRLWQQLVYSHNPFNKGRLSHRLRFEERFIKNFNDVYRFSDRLRYQIGYMVPLQGKTLDPDEFYLNASCEIYFSLSNPPERPRNAFHSEDWIYVALGYNTKKMGRVEVGQVFQTTVRNRKHDRRDLILLQVLWVTNFNFKDNSNK